VAPRVAAVREWMESAARPTIRRGSRGNAVRETQSKLNAVHTRQLAAGQPGLPACPLEVDGIFGDLTFQAVQGFQRQVAFPTEPKEWDGIVGPKTWAALDQFAGVIIPEPPVPPPTPPRPEPSVVDPRIDVCAQFAIQRMRGGDAAAQADGAGMLVAVKSGQLAGILNNTTLAAVQLAKRHNVTRFDLVPKGENAALVLEPGDPVGALPPTLVFRGVETKPGGEDALPAK